MKIINVSKGFFSRFKTIKSAVDHAKAGETIVVEPGTYTEILYINKPITIQGNGSKEQIILEGGITISSNVKLEHISITKNNLQQIDVGLLVNAGKAVVTDCLITRFDSTGIMLKQDSELELNNSTTSYVHCGVKVYGNAFFLIKGSNVINCTGNGIWIVDNARGIIDDCVFQENESAQIALENGSDITIQNSKIHSGQSNGIYIKNANGTILNCGLYENQNSQIYISDGGNATINDSTIRLGKKETNGIYVGNSSLKMENSKVSEHDYPQIFVTEKSTIQLKKLKICEGEGSGIRILESSTGVIEECEMSSNGLFPQISIESDSNITIQNSHIHSGNNQGIKFDRAKGVIFECVIEQNQSRQVEIHNGSNVEMKTTVINNGKSETNGVFVSDRSIVEMDFCIISDHDYPQIFVEQKSKIHLIKTKVIDGKDSGGMRILESIGLIDQCEFSNNGAYPHISIENKSDITVENCQIHSGQGYGININNSKGIINDCSLYENEFVQLDIENSSYAEVNRCRIYKGMSNGVRISSNATALFQDVNVYDHPENYSQVVIKTGGNPIFRRCKVFEGHADGFYFVQNGLGTIEDCYVYDNQSNFSILEDSEPILRRNRILNGKQYGVYVADSNPIIENCIFSDNDLDDIYIDENSKPILLQNEFTSKTVNEARHDADNSHSKYEEALGFNPYNMKKDELKARLLDEKKKWLNRINAPNFEKRQEAERMLMLIEDLEKELLINS